MYTISNNIEVYEQPVPRTKKIQSNSRPVRIKELCTEVCTASWKFSNLSDGLKTSFLKISQEKWFQLKMNCLSSVSEQLRFGRWTILPDSSLPFVGICLVIIANDFLWFWSIEFVMRLSNFNIFHNLHVCHWGYWIGFFSRQLKTNRVFTMLGGGVGLWFIHRTGTCSQKSHCFRKANEGVISLWLLLMIEDNLKQ